MFETMNHENPVLLLTGASGLLGQHIIHSLSDQFKIVPLNRVGANPNKPQWNYQETLSKLSEKQPFVVIHLAGAGIADKRWSKHYKKTLYDSRIKGTEWLVQAIQSNSKMPEAFFSASAIGYYGDRPGEQLTESAGTGDNFVAHIARDWEAASTPLLKSGIRTIQLRFGMLLSAQGGALKDMLLPFKLGLGGRLGDGKQQYSWIDIHDAVRAISFLINKCETQGVYNLTSPYPVSNAEFSKSLAKTLKRPAFMHMPAFMVRLSFGEMADELLLADASVIPKRLTQAGFEFKYPKLTDSLTKQLK